MVNVFPFNCEIDNSIKQLNNADLDSVFGGSTAFQATCKASFVSAGTYIGRAVTAGTGGWGAIPGGMIGTYTGIQACPSIESSVSGWANRFAAWFHRMLN